MSEPSLLQQAQHLAGALAESLFTMGFLDAVPTDAPAPFDNPVLVRIPFTGPFRGALELLASASLGELLAANMLGITPDDPDARLRGQDAIKELANVTCGLLLSRLESSPKPAMKLPSVHAVSPTRFDALAARPGAALLDVEGHPLAARVRGFAP